MERYFWVLPLSLLCYHQVDAYQSESTTQSSGNMTDTEVTGLSQGNLTFPMDSLEVAERIFELQKEKIKQHQEDMSNLQHELLRNYAVEIVTLKETVSKQQEDIDFLKREYFGMKQKSKAIVENSVAIEKLLDPPKVFACGYQGEWRNRSTIAYDSVFYEKNNQKTGGLDTGRGVFTTPCAGTYTVTWSLHTSNYYQGGQQAVLYLYKNGVKVDESKHVSSLDRLGDDNEYKYRDDEGGRYLNLFLDQDDEISLRSYSGEASLYNIMFCVGLS